MSADDQEQQDLPFSAALTLWRERRGLTKKKLAATMGAYPAQGRAAEGQAVPGSSSR